MNRLTLSLLVASLTGSPWAIAADAPVPQEPPPPVREDNAGFRDVLVRVGDSLLISGQPSAEALERLAREGVTTVINLRTEPEMASREAVPFDEADLLRRLDVRYVHIPLGGPDTPYSPDAVDRFAEALRDAPGKVLLHCTVGWRASHLYTAYLHRHRGIPLDVAIAHGQAINFGTLPLEGFLGVPLEYRANE